MKKQFDKDGFIIIRSFFSDEEVSKLRTLGAKANAYSRKPRCISTFDGSEVIFNNKRLYSLLHNLIGGKPYYFGDSSIVENMGHSRYSEGSGLFHKDCIDRADYSKPDWHSNYTVVRVATYPFASKSQGGSVALRRCSHKPGGWRSTFLRRKPFVYLLDLLDALSGVSVYANIEPSDIVIWKFTTDHAGLATSLRFKNAPITRYTNYIPQLFRLPRFSGESRVGIFVAFGANDSHLKRYLTGVKRRKYMLESWINTLELNSGVQPSAIGLFPFVDALEGVTDLNLALANGEENWRPLDA